MYIYSVIGRNVGPNLILFRCQGSRQISLGNPNKCGNNRKKRAFENEKPKGSEIDSKKGNDNKKKDYPEEPTTCCMSGCANCVWLDYAEKLSEYYRDGGEQAIKEINEKVTDQNIRAFLLHELRMRNIKWEYVVYFFKMFTAEVIYGISPGANQRQKSGWNSIFF